MVTWEVLKLDKSSSIKEEQFAKIYCISLINEVLNFDTSKDIKEEQP